MAGSLRLGSAATRFGALRFFVLAYLLTWAAWLPMFARPDQTAAPALPGQPRTDGRCLVLAAAAMVPFLLYAAGWSLSALLGEPLAPLFF